MGDVISFFQSTTPRTVKVRDEGQDAREAVKDKKTGKVVERAQLERLPWPEGNYIYLKSMVSAGDQEKITEYTMHAVWKDKGDGSEEQEMQTEFALHRASVATAAVMIDRFEGPNFVDDDGKTPTMPSDDDMEGRLAVARRLASAIVAFVDQEVNERNKNPLGLTRAEKPSKGGSTPR